MPQLFRLLSIILLFSFDSSLCSAQSIPCPRPKRQKVYTEPPQLFVDAALGISYPMMYRNTGALESHFHFASRPGPYAATTGHMKYPNGLEFTLGAEFLQNEQGLVMKYGESDANVREAGYTGSIVLRMPVGVGYYIKPSWTINAAAFIAYTSYWTYTSNGRQSINGGSGGSLSTQLQWQVPDAYNSWYPGITLSSQARLYRRLGVRAFCSMDFGQATPNAATISLSTGSGSETLRATLEPYLMNVGLAVNYRFGKLEE